jgi:putative flippase GtrA
MIIFNPRERSRFIKFAVVGTIGAVVDFGFFNLLFSLVGLSLEVSQAISFSAAVINNFIWNRFWTYPDSRSKSILRQIVQFFIINVIGLGIRTLLLISPMTASLVKAVELVAPQNFFMTSKVIGSNLGLAVAIVVVMLWNFFVNRFWTYNDVK